GICIDLGDPDWTAIGVDASGWRHVERPTVRFIRPRGMLALPVPEKGGSIELLRPFLNVADEADWKLEVGFLVMMFRPAGPYPVFGLHGEQGSAKTTAMRVNRKLVDPRETLDRSAPRNDHDLAIHAMHHWVVALDNLSRLPAWLSDALARLATGSGFSTRQLYTDADEFSFSAARPVMLNGIGEVITRSDLLDRAVLVNFEPIADSARKLEDDFWAEFEAARPRILGALLDAVSTAIRRESNVAMNGWPRMADFARWVTAAEPALGWPEGSFLAAYYANRGMANEMALEADPLAVTVRDLMMTTVEWRGRPSELLDKLTAIAGDATSRRKDWPAAANTLSNRLERLAPNLRRIGINVERTKGAHGRRTIRLTIVSRSSPPSPPTSAEEVNETATRTATDRHPSPTGPPPVERGSGDGGDVGDPLRPFYAKTDEPADLWRRAQDIFADLLPEAQA
ncbi:MAG TPA: hypothetical protein VJZ50_05585, partial [Candidatus Limnocylindrales bacterium]|nr:hypothetical protein [Candidatus Limnocylindrales bacterium]